MKTRLILLIGLLFNALSSFVSANIIEIPNDYAIIQDAIDSCDTGDTILVQPGTYFENINFNGKSIVLGSLFLTTGDTSFISTTVIDGDSSGSVVTFENGEDTSAVIAGFTILNGWTDFGGGIHCTDASPGIYNNYIRENRAIGTDSVVSRGGGIYCCNSNARILNNIIQNNLSMVTWFWMNDGEGGGIYCGFNSDPCILNNLIINNKSKNGGGILCHMNSNPDIEKNMISENYCFSAEWGQRGKGGGISCADSSSPNIYGNIIYNNTSTSWGGGIYCEDSSNPKIINSVIYGNTGTGAAVYCANSVPYIVNTIIQYNYNWPGSPQVYGDSFIISYCNIEGGWEGVGNIDENPLILNTDFEICSQSPCIDAGDPGILDPDGSRSDIGLFFPEHRECFTGNVLHVAVSGDDDLGDGSAEYPFKTVSKAVDVAGYGDTVLVHNGTYHEKPFVLSKSIFLVSDYAYSNNCDDIHNTVIDGDSSGNVITFSNCDSTPVLAGFTIRRGWQTTTLDDGYGVALYNSDAIIQNNLITNNFQDILSEQSQSEIVNCVITKSYWAGIYNGSWSDPKVTNCTITGNNGSGINCTHGPITASNSIIWGNREEIIPHYNLGSVTITYSDVAGGFEGEGNIDDDPLLASPDYNICAASPCIDAGNPIISDPDGSRSDMGVYFPSHPECSVGNMRFVSTDGDDISGDGTHENPFKTIQHAIDLSFSSDTVIVEQGTYDEDVRLYGKNILLASNYIFTGDSLDIFNTIINGDSAAYGATLTISGSNYTASLIGFAIRDGYHFGINCFNTDILISHNIIDGNNLEGINCKKSDPVITQNIIRNNRSGISSNISSPQVIGNIIEENESRGITCDENAIVKNNVIRNNAGSGIRCRDSTVIDSNIIIWNGGPYESGGGIYCGTGSGIIARYNVICGNTGIGIYCNTSSPTFVNNTVSSNSGNYGGNGFSLVNGSEALIVNTIIWDNSPQEIYTDNTSKAGLFYCDIKGGWTAYGTGNFDIDPMFCDAENEDFHLAENSLCLGGGQNGANIGALGVGCTMTDITENDGGDELLPKAFELSQNYPNPFNPTTLIEYALPVNTMVSLNIYNILGQKVKTLVNHRQNVGWYSIRWNGTDDYNQYVAAGIYFYRIDTDRLTESRKMILLK